MKTIPVLAATALALAACTPDFDPASRIDKLRVLAVRADPPEIAPAPSGGAAAVAPDRAAVTALVLRADFATDPERGTTVVYVACLPVPGDPTPTPCVTLASLRDPTTALVDAAAAACAASSTGAAPPPVAFAGAERCQGGACGPVTLDGGVVLPAPEVALPAGYGFDALPAGAPDRILGVEAVALAFAIDAEPSELAPEAGAECPLASVASRLSELWASREHVLAVKRVHVRGPEAPDAPNHNPALDGIAVDGAPLADGTSSALVTGVRQLTPVLPDGADSLREAYTKLDAAGAPIESAREEWVYSWFSTAGDLKDLHTRDPLPTEEWTIGASDASAGGTRALVAAVVRDRRGGEVWTVREVTISR
jgi:hypothetical protein